MGDFKLSFTAKDIDDKLGRIPNGEIVTSDALQEALDNIAIPDNLKSGTGEKSLVIGTGDASGDYAIAGGSNDSSLVGKLVNSDILALLPTSIDQSSAEGILSIALGADAKAISSGSMAVGVQAYAGAKGFYWWSIDFGSNTLTLSNNQKPVILGTRKWTDEAKTQLSSWKVDDEITIVNDKIYTLCSKITAIDTENGTITVDNLPFTSTTSKILPLNDDYSVVNPSKPQYGVVELGFGARAYGVMNKAAGTLSYVEGKNNIGAGDFSHVEGSENTGGYIAHAEGNETKALGNYSHSEGQGTLASGNSAHAEGNSTQAIGSYSHAEGYSTIASGYNTHAEGRNTVASGQYSHAEGWDSIASGKTSHVEGDDNRAVGEASHAEGWKTRAMGDYSHAEGVGNAAIGYGSHAEGVSYKFKAKFTGEANALTYTVSSILYFVEGGQIEYSSNRFNVVSIDEDNKTVTFDNTLSADVALFEQELECSKCTTASGDYSHAEGSGTVASNKYSHAEGWDTRALGQTSHAEGDDTRAIGEASHSEGWKSKAEGKYSHAEGIGSTAASLAQHVQGQYNKKDTLNEYAHIVGNGTSDSKRSNAHTLDWSGNAWYQGNVYVGGTSQEEGSALATTKYVDEHLVDVATTKYVDEHLADVATKAWVEALIGGIENGTY